MKIKVNVNHVHRTGIDLPVLLTPNGHSVESVTAADSIAQNAVATATPTMYHRNVQYT